MDANTDFCLTTQLYVDLYVDGVQATQFFTVKSGKSHTVLGRLVPGGTAVQEYLFTVPRARPLPKDGTGPPPPPPEPETIRIEVFECKLGAEYVFKGGNPNASLTGDTRGAARAAKQMDALCTKDWRSSASVVLSLRPRHRYLGEQEERRGVHHNSR